MVRTYVFKLPQNTVLGKRNYDNKLNLAHQSRHIYQKITSNGNAKPRGIPEKENHPSLFLRYLVNRDRGSRCGHLKIAYILTQLLRWVFHLNFETKCFLRHIKA